MIHNSKRIKKKKKTDINFNALDLMVEVKESNIRYATINNYGNKHKDITEPLSSTACKENSSY